MKYAQKFFGTLGDIVLDGTKSLSIGHMMACLLDEPPFFSVIQFLLTGGFWSRIFGAVLSVIFYVAFFLLRIVAYPILVFLRTLFGVGTAPTYWGRVFENIWVFIFWVVAFAYLASKGAYEWLWPIVIRFLE